jgi:8-oxo-dGTP pyrophosphatase MutT (NUDIX family)
VTIREPLRHVLLERQEERLSGHPATPASVLIPLVERGGEVHVWLIKRTETMTKHRGQVAFPGGKRDPEDRDAIETAVRETHEELGWPRDAIEVHGRLDDLATSTGFLITPFVGWLRRDLVPVPNAREIAKAFCVPLAQFVFVPPRPQIFRGDGITRFVPSWHVDGEVLWGASAKIMKGFAGIVRDVLSRHRF